MARTWVFAIHNHGKFYIDIKLKAEGCMEGTDGLKSIEIAPQSSFETTAKTKNTVGTSCYNSTKGVNLLVNGMVWLGSGEFGNGPMGQINVVERRKGYNVVTGPKWEMIVAGTYSTRSITATSQRTKGVELIKIIVNEQGDLETLPPEDRPQP